MPSARKDTAGSLNDSLVWAIRDLVGQRGRPKSQKSLAALIGVHESTLSNYLNEDPEARTLMHVAIVEDIAGALGMEPLELFQLAKRGPHQPFDPRRGGPVQ